MVSSPPLGVGGDKHTPSVVVGRVAAGRLAPRPAYCSSLSSLLESSHDRLRPLRFRNLGRGSPLLLGIILAGGPLWAVIPIGMICCTITLYRHFDIPPHRR